MTATTPTTSPFGELQHLSTQQLVDLLIRYTGWQALGSADGGWLGFDPPPRSYSTARLGEIRDELRRRRRHELTGVLAS
ncbi:MAG: hypothetical protein M3Q71_08595 [Chloroflexota bacterium]|nr:hypothetical protein [Chloroflexota bacterium]